MFAPAEEKIRLSRAHNSLPALLRILLDPLAIIAALCAVAIGYGEPLESPYVILSLIVFSLTFPGRSHLDSSAGTLARDIAVGWLFLFLTLFFFGYATRTLHLFPPAVLVGWFFSAPVALFVGHRCLRSLLPRIVNRESNQRRAVIVGANAVGLDLAGRLRDTSLLGIRLVGFFDDRERSRLSGLDSVPLYGNFPSLAHFVREQRIDIIYIALPMASQPRILGLLGELTDTTASIYFVPDIFVADLVQARMDSVGGLPVLAVCETPFYGANGFIKRAFDVVLSAFILVAIAPLMLVIALWVKLDSPGPVLFRQRRYGLDGNEIVVYKFRSMKVCDDGAVITQATRADPRVTRSGTVLRALSLDELPQFVNVLQGRMSIVGPRPHAVAHNETYRKLIKSYMVRHKVKPGITGWAQVNGLRGETDTLELMRARIEHDLDYLRNWSVKLDLHIMFRTVVTVLRDRNAY